MRGDCFELTSILKSEPPGTFATCEVCLPEIEDHRACRVSSVCQPETYEITLYRCARRITTLLLNEN